MYRDMMVKPAEGDQIVRIMISAPTAGVDVMDFEPIVERTAIHGAFAVTVEDMTSHLGADRPLPVSQGQGFALFGDPDHFDDPITQDVF